MRTLEQKKEIAEYYNLGHSLKETSEKFQVSSTGIIIYLKLFGYKTRSIRDGMKKQKIDETFFEKIDKHIKAQILGMIYADGCLYKQKTHDTYVLTISLKSNDYYYLNNINFILKNERPIKIFKISTLKKDGTYPFATRFSTNNYKIAQDIQKLGIHPRKSLDLNFPTSNQVPEQFIPSFLLGYFEGDGCICKSNGYISIMCTEEFANSIIKICKEKLNIYAGFSKRKKHKEQNKNIGCLQIGGGIQSMKFLDWIYSNSTKELRLERKYQIYKNYRAKYDDNLNLIKNEDWHKNFKEKVNNARKKLNGKVFREFYIKSPEGKIYFSNRAGEFAKKYGFSKRQLTNLLNNHSKICHNWTNPTQEEINISGERNNIIYEIFEPKVQKKSEIFTNFYLKHDSGQIYFAKTLYKLLEKFNNISKRHIRNTIKNKVWRKNKSMFIYPTDQEIEIAKQNNTIIILE